MEQCWICIGYFFFKPLPDETFAYCKERGEGLADIDLRTGVSPAIEKYGLKGIPCDKFKEGKSICHTSEERPFLLHPVRETGEMFLRSAIDAEG